VSCCADMTEKSVVYGYLPMLGEAGGVGSVTVGGLASSAPDSIGTGGPVSSLTGNFRICSSVTGNSWAGRSVTGDS
jgi:hypothetical protein